MYGMPKKCVDSGLDVRVRVRVRVRLHSSRHSPGVEVKYSVTRTFPIIQPGRSTNSMKGGLEIGK